MTIQSQVFHALSDRLFNKMFYRLYPHSVHRCDYLVCRRISDYQVGTMSSHFETKLAVRLNEVK